SARRLGVPRPAMRRKLTGYAVRRQALPEPAARPPESPRERAPEIPANENRASTPVAEGQAIAAENEIRSVAPAIESAPAEPAEEIRALVPVPQADNDPAAQPAPITSESAPVAQQPEPVAPQSAPVASQFAPVVLPPPPAPPRRQRAKLLPVGAAIGGAVTAVLIAMIGFGYFGRGENGAEFAAAERPRLEIQPVEQAPAFEQRIVVPTWN